MKKKKVKVKKAAPAAKTPAKKVDKSRIGHTIGVNSGKGVSETWSALLRANVKRKLTDEQITRKMKKEFPKRSYLQPVGRIRSFYNRGIQGFGNPTGSNLRGTAKESVAYDANGEPTANSMWGRDKKVNPARSKAAKKRAQKQWSKRKPAKKKKVAPVVKKKKVKPVAKKKAVAKAVKTAAKRLTKAAKVKVKVRAKKPVKIRVKTVAAPTAAPEAAAA